RDLSRHHSVVYQRTGAASRRCKTGDAAVAIGTSADGRRPRSHRSSERQVLSRRHSEQRFRRSYACGSQCQGPDPGEPKSFGKEPQMRATSILERTKNFLERARQLAGFKDRLSESRVKQAMERDFHTNDDDDDDDEGGPPRMIDYPHDSSSKVN